MTILEFISLFCFLALLNILSTTRHLGGLAGGHSFLSLSTQIGSITTGVLLGVILIITLLVLNDYWVSWSNK